MNLNVRKLEEEEEEKLRNLGVIEAYLTRAIDEHQKILGSHFDLKALYTKELEQLSQMSFIRRFSLRNELYEKLMDYPEGLERMEIFLRPLFGNLSSKEGCGAAKTYSQKGKGGSRGADGIWRRRLDAGGRTTAAGKVGFIQG